jgi:hypothetical protein
MDQSDVQKPKWRRIRWAWFAFAAYAILGTPTAIIGAIEMGKSHHRLAPVMLIALAIRGLMIWFFLALWWQLRPAKQAAKPQTYEVTSNEPHRVIGAQIQTFDGVWYLSGDSIWRIFRLLAYQDIGKLAVSDSGMEFKSNQQTIVIDRIRSVSFGKQGRDFVNNWVKIEYEAGGSCHRAFFADGGSHGWDGVLGGTRRILEAIKRLPIVVGDSAI